MSTLTQYIGFNIIESGDADPISLINENWKILDLILPYPRLADIDETNPANVNGGTGPVDGEAYFIDGVGTASTAWEGHTREIAIYLDSKWYFLPTEKSMLAYSVEDDAMIFRQTEATNTWNFFTAGFAWTC